MGAGALHRASATADCAVRAARGTGRAGSLLLIARRRGLAHARLRICSLQPHLLLPLALGTAASLRPVTRCRRLPAVAPCRTLLSTGPAAHWAACAAACAASGAAASAASNATAGVASWIAAYIAANYTAGRAHSPTATFAAGAATSVAACNAAGRAASHGPDRRGWRSIRMSLRCIGDYSMPGRKRTRAATILTTTLA